jgi:hypothetical protein
MTPAGTISWQVHPATWYVEHMDLDANMRRRWLGGAALSASLVMLVLGETLLKDRLRAIPFLLYWLACFCLTSLAMLVALMDARSLRRRAREQRRDLLTTALKEIEVKAKGRAQPRIDNQKR